MNVVKEYKRGNHYVSEHLKNGVPMVHEIYGKGFVDYNDRGKGPFVRFYAKGKKLMVSENSLYNPTNA